MVMAIPLSTKGKLCGDFGHKRKSDGKPCTRRAMANGCCYVHGGPTPKGIASPHFKHGKYSDHIPTRLSSRFHESLSDPELTNQRSDIALLDARLCDVLDSVSNQESGELWQALHKAKQHYHKGNEEERTEALEHRGSSLAKDTKRPSHGGRYELCCRRDPC